MKGKAKYRQQRRQNERSSNNNYISHKLAEDLDGKPASATFDAETRERLRQDYDAAVDEGKDSFMFNGTELIVGYAKYLIEYLDMVLVE